MRRQKVSWFYRFFSPSIVSALVDFVQLVIAHSYLDAKPLDHQKKFLIHGGWEECATPNLTRLDKSCASDISHWCLDLVQFHKEGKQDTPISSLIYPRLFGLAGENLSLVWLFLRSANWFFCSESAYIGKSKLTSHQDVATPTDLPRAQSFCGWHSGKHASVTADILAPIIINCHRHSGLPLTPVGFANFIKTSSWNTFGRSLYLQGQFVSPPF